MFGHINRSAIKTVQLHPTLSGLRKIGKKMGRQPGYVLVISSSHQFRELFHRFVGCGCCPVSVATSYY